MDNGDTGYDSPTYRDPFDGRVEQVTLFEKGCASDLLRLAVTRRYDLNMSVITKVASLTAACGVSAALAWLDGYWYVTGVKDFDTVVAIQEILNNAL